MPPDYPDAIYEADWLMSAKGLEAVQFKRDVRKLKNLGLTISLGTGADRFAA